MSVLEPATGFVQIQELVAIRRRLITVEDPKTLYVTGNGTVMTVRQQITLDAIQETYPEARWGMKGERVLVQTRVGIFVIIASGNHSLVTKDGIMLHLPEDYVLYLPED